MPGIKLPKNYWPSRNFFRPRSLFFLAFIAAIIIGAIYIITDRNNVATRQQQTDIENQKLLQDIDEVSNRLEAAETEVTNLKNEDQFQRNEKLQAEIKNIETTYTQTVQEYERILDLRSDGGKVTSLETQFSQILSQLAKRDYVNATATLQTLKTNIQTVRSQLDAAQAPVPENIPASNTPPASGYSRQAVETEIGRFQVDILSADLGSTKVVVETASSSDCRDNCPVSSLADFVARAGGYAGINGPYFCPAEYPSCAGKTNSFDTLLMNKNKTYFNSDNNVYSTVPAYIFSTSARLVGRSSEWGRDTSPDSVIASQPMVLGGGNITFGGDGDPKKGSRGNRSFIANKGNTVYIGVVRSATVAEVGYVLKTLGLENGLNLDSGGSTAFYVNGRYVAGPGRNTPFGIVLVRR